MPHSHKHEPAAGGREHALAVIDHDGGVLADAESTDLSFKVLGAQHGVHALGAAEFTVDIKAAGAGYAGASAGELADGGVQNDQVRGGNIGCQPLGSHDGEAQVNGGSFGHHQPFTGIVTLPCY